MTKLKVLDLFSGIGGFSLGLERTGGFETVAFCEIDPFCRKVLAKHWPNVRQYEDVRELNADTLARDGIAVDVICGGFPCQDISVSGRRTGIGQGTRSGLWSEISRLAGELSPSYILVENVANLLGGPSEQPGGWFGRILGDLAEVGYDAEWHCISAANVGAPHIRDRVWILAYPMQIGQFKQGGSEAAACDEERHFAASKCARPAVSNTIVPSGKILPNPKQVGFHDGGWGAEPDVGRMAHGVSDGMDRVGSLGNAVVPQIPEIIGRAILESMEKAA